jgi:hypothetical protein
VPSRIGLVGCVKEKRRTPAAARDLYTSPLFTGRRRAVERSCDQWFVLSALHGLVEPGQRLEPYDVTLNSMGRADRRRWAADVVQSLQRRLGSLEGLHFELHAGASYLEYGLIDALVGDGATVSWPTRGLPMGKQLQYYRGS